MKLRPAAPVAGAKRPSVGRRVLSSPVLEEAGELAVFTMRGLWALPGSVRYASEIIRVNAIITRRTTTLLFFMSCFLGISGASFAFTVLRSLGASDFVGIVPGLLDTRTLAPQMFGYVFAGAVGCAIAAELGAARVQEEVDAYEAQGVDPMQLLVGTRVLAALMYAPLGAAVAMFGIFAGGFFDIVVVFQGNTAHQFIDTFFSIVPISSVFYCTITIAALTLQCTIVACFYGLRHASGGPETVGAGVARSLAINIVLLHIVFAMFGLLFYAGNLQVPIGD